MKKHKCDLCNYSTVRYNDLTKHLNSGKHKEKVVIPNQENPKAPEITSEILIVDDIRNVNKNDKAPILCENVIAPEPPKPIEKVFYCKFCDNTFSRASSCTRHMKICYAGVADSKEIKTENEKLKAEINMLHGQLKSTTDDKMSFKNMAESCIETNKVFTDAFAFVIKKL